MIAFDSTWERLVSEYNDNCLFWFKWLIYAFLVGNINFFYLNLYRNKNLNEDGKGAAVYSDRTSSIYLIFSKFIMNLSRGKANGDRKKQG